VDTTGKKNQLSAGQRKRGMDGTLTEGRRGDKRRLRETNLMEENARKRSSWASESIQLGPHLFVKRVNESPKRRKKLRHECTSLLARITKLLKSPKTTGD